MKQLRRHFLGFLLLAGWALPLAAQMPANLADKLKRIEQMIQEEMQKNAVPGMSITIAQAGKVIYARGCGYADVENKVPFTPFSPQSFGNTGAHPPEFVAAIGERLSGWGSGQIIAGTRRCKRSEEIVLVQE